jgi:hypothetical protein
LPHFGQFVLLVVSITFFRSAVLAILAMLGLLTAQADSCARKLTPE